LWLRICAEKSLNTLPSAPAATTSASTMAAARIASARLSGRRRKRARRSTKSGGTASAATCRKKPGVSSSRASATSVRSALRNMLGSKYTP
jgi:hypothetical protein